MEFDKALLADLLKKAKDDRSINKFGDETNVDSGYISRLLRCRVAKPPSAMVLLKIAEKAANDVTVEQLMSASGYLKSPLEPVIIEVENNNAPTKKQIIDDSEADALLSFIEAIEERPNLLQVFEQLIEFSNEKLLRVLKVIKMINQMGD